MVRVEGETGKLMWRGLHPLTRLGQVVVERWRQGTPSEFWAEFSAEDGKHLTFTSIIDRLRHSRKAEDERITEIAKAEYGASFAENFSYRKGGNKRVMTDPTIIAKHYRLLQDS